MCGKWSGDPHQTAVVVGGTLGCPGVVGRTSRLSGSSQEFLWMSRSGGKPLRISGRCREARADVQKWSGDPLGCTGVVEKPSQMSERGREALPNVLEWSGGLPECLSMVGSPYRMSGSGRESFPDV